MSVVPNPETLVKQNGYINANEINIGEFRFIATQAPLPNTFADFYEILYAKSTVVVMLTQLIENERTKADQYWPELREACESRQLYIANKKEMKLFSDITIRQLCLGPVKAFEGLNEFQNCAE